jgi:hypothetical protein
MSSVKVGAYDYFSGRWLYLHPGVARPIRVCVKNKIYGGNGTCLDKRLEKSLEIGLGSGN